MIVPVSQTKFPSLISAIQTKTEEFISQNTDVLTEPVLRTIAGLLLIYNVKVSTIKKEGGYVKLRDRVAGWLRNVRGTSAVASALKYDDFDFAVPINIAGKEITNTAEAFEEGGILGFFCACTNQDLRYAKSDRTAQEYNGAAALARDNFVLPLLRRRVRVNKIDQPSKLDSGSMFADLDALFPFNEPMDNTRRYPAGDNDVKYLASVVFSVAVKRTYLLSTAYSDDASIIRDHLGMTPFGRATKGCQFSGKEDWASVFQPITHKGQEYPKFVRPVAFIDNGNFSYTSVTDPQFMSDPENIDKLHVSNWKTVPDGLAKRLLAAHCKQNSITLSDDTPLFSYWIPLGDGSAPGLNASILQFVLNHVRTYTGVTTSLSVAGAGKALWTKVTRLAFTIRSFCKEASHSISTWSDRQVVQGYFLGMSREAADKPVSASLIVYSAHVPEETITKLSAYATTPLFLFFRGHDGNIVYKVRVNFTVKETKYPKNEDSNFLDFSFNWRVEEV